MKRRFLAALLTLCMLVAMLPQIAITATANAYPGTNIEWTFDDETGRLTIGGTGNMRDDTDLNNVTIHYNFDNSLESGIFNGHKYQLYNDAVSWEEAKSKCENRGGHLATISSAEENTFLYNYIVSKGVKDAYFGLSDLETEGTWKWVTGEEVIYTNWASGEPNSETSREDYAMFYYKYPNGKWNDGAFGGSSPYYICEWDSASDCTSQSRDVCLADLECVDESHYTGNKGDARVYKLDGTEFTGFAPKGYNGGTSCNGNIGLDGTVYENGFEVWIARWNFGDNISWAYRTFKLGGNYRTLTGSSGIIKSYNTTNYDVTAYFYSGDTLLYSFQMTPESNQFDFTVDVSGVNELKVLAKDNKKTAGGTSYALYNLFLDRSSSNQSDVFCEKTYIANIWANQRDDMSDTTESGMIQDLMQLDSVSETIYTSLSNNNSFRNSLAGWNGMKLAFDPVSGVDELFLSGKLEIYETLILDLIERRAKAEGETFSNIIFDAVDTAGDVGSKVTKYKKSSIISLHLWMFPMVNCWNI